MIKLTHLDMIAAAKKVAQQINEDFFQFSVFDTLIVYPVPRGGVACAYLVLNFMSHKQVFFTEDPTNAHIAIDDIVDSGKTKEYIMSRSRNKHMKFYNLFDNSQGWIEFPFERQLENSASTSIDDAILRLSQYFGIKEEEMETFKERVLNL